MATVTLYEQQLAQRVRITVNGQRFESSVGILCAYCATFRVFFRTEIYRGASVFLYAFTASEEEMERGSAANGSGMSEVEVALTEHFNNAMDIADGKLSWMLGKRRTSRPTAAVKDAESDEQKEDAAAQTHHDETRKSMPTAVQMKNAAMFRSSFRFRDSITFNNTNSNPSHPPSTHTSCPRSNVAALNRTPSPQKATPPSLPLSPTPALKEDTDNNPVEMSSFIPPSNVSSVQSTPNVSAARTSDANKSHVHFDPLTGGEMGMLDSIAMFIPSAKPKRKKDESDNDAVCADDDDMASGNTAQDPLVMNSFATHASPMIFRTDELPLATVVHYDKRQQMWSVVFGTRHGRHSNPTAQTDDAAAAESEKTGANNSDYNNKKIPLQLHADYIGVLLVHLRKRMREDAKLAAALPAPKPSVSAPNRSASGKRSSSGNNNNNNNNTKTNTNSTASTSASTTTSWWANADPRISVSEQYFEHQRKPTAVADSLVQLPGTTSNPEAVAEVVPDVGRRRRSSLFASQSIVGGRSLVGPSASRSSGTTSTSASTVSLPIRWNEMSFVTQVSVSLVVRTFGIEVLYEDYADPTASPTEEEDEEEDQGRSRSRSRGRNAQRNGGDVARSQSGGLRANGTAAAAAVSNESKLQQEADPLMATTLDVDRDEMVEGLAAARDFYSKYLSNQKKEEKQNVEKEAPPHPSTQDDSLDMRMMGACCGRCGVSGHAESQCPHK